MCGITLDHVSMWGYSHLFSVWEKPYSYDNRIAPLRGKKDMHGPKHYTTSFSWYGYWYIHDSPLQAEHWGDLSSHRCLPTIHSFAPSIIYLILLNVPFLISTSCHKASVSSICTLIGMFPGSSPTFQLHQLPPCMCMVDVTRQILHHCWTSLSKQHTVDGFVMVHSWWMLFSNNRVLSAKAATQV